jgi:transcriptional regulator with XRE-family HTH domain
MKIIKELYTIRKCKNLTHQELANRIGCTNVYISLLETRKQTPSLKFLKRWAKALGYSISINLIKENNHS